MAILWDHANSIEWYAGEPAAGALAYFYVGGTTTPLVVYQDAGESTPTTTPVVADANGRWPDVFIPFTTSYDVRVTSSTGTQLYYPQQIPNPDPTQIATGTILTSSSQLFQTGGMRFEVAIGTAPAGWVRANALTIGSGTSGATERANPDTFDLFSYLWNSAPDSVLPVLPGGRGVSPAADFGLNKTITLPDFRGAPPVGADDMGNTAAGRFASATFSLGSATIGASVAGGDVGGGNARTILTANLAVHAHNTGTLVLGSQNALHFHSGTTTAISGGTPAGSVSAPSLTTAVRGDIVSGTPGGGQSNVGGAVVQASKTGDDGTIVVPGAQTFTGSALATHTHTLTTSTENAFHSHTMSGSTASAGSDTPLSILSRSVLGTWLIKL